MPLDLDRSLSLRVDFGSSKPEPSDILEAIFNVITDPAGLLCLQPLNASAFELTVSSPTLAEKLYTSGLSINDTIFNVYPAVDSSRWVRFHNLPFQFPNSSLTDFLLRFGQVKSDVIWEKWPGGLGLPNGTRKVKMDITLPIPETIVIENFRTRVYYPGIIRLCHLCEKPGHLKINCPGHPSSSPITAASPPKATSSSKESNPPISTVTITPTENSPALPTPSVQPATTPPTSPAKNKKNRKRNNLPSLQVKGFAFVRIQAEKLPPAPDYKVNRSFNFDLFNDLPATPEAQSRIFKSRPSWTDMEIDILEKYESLGPENFAKEVDSFKEYWNIVDHSRIIAAYYGINLNSRASNSLPMLDWDHVGLKLVQSGLGFFKPF